MLKAWQENEERAAAFAQVIHIRRTEYLCRHRGTLHCSCFILQVAEVSHLDDEIMALHSEIVELQRSPYARRQGDKMEQL